MIFRFLNFKILNIRVYFFNFIMYKILNFRTLELFDSIIRSEMLAKKSNNQVLTVEKIIELNKILHSEISEIFEIFKF